MANLGRTINGVDTLANGFTARVVYDSSDRYGGPQANQEFIAGYEYVGVNFFKDQNRPPRLRILLVFQPLINGNPNSNNDTYVAFQIYDYDLNVFRGPFCKTNNINNLTYVDYFVTTIDSFGRKYGNIFTGNGSTYINSFNPPTVTFSTRASLYLATLESSVTIAAGHEPSTFILGGPNNQTFHFHGFITLVGYNGTWCFYSIAANGTGLGFYHLLDEAPYNSNTYPYLLPYTSKLTSEWRYATFCNLSNISYTPRVRPVTLGNIKYYDGQVPEQNFPINQNIQTVDVWCDSNAQSANDFFQRILWSPGSDDVESALGVEGTPAANHAPAGWYGTSVENSYAYYNGNGTWQQNSYNTYTPVQSTEITLYFIGNNFETDMAAACLIGQGGTLRTVYINSTDSITSVNTLVYDDANLTTQPNFGNGNGWIFYHQPSNNSLELTNNYGTGSMRVNAVTTCNQGPGV